MGAGRKTQSHGNLSGPGPDRRVPIPQDRCLQDELGGCIFGTTRDTIKGARALFLSQPCLSRLLTHATASPNTATQNATTGRSSVRDAPVNRSIAPYLEVFLIHSRGFFIREVCSQVSRGGTFRTSSTSGGGCPCSCSTTVVRGRLLPPTERKHRLCSETSYEPASARPF